MRNVNSLTLTFAFMRYRPLAALISVVVFGLGIAILCLLLLFGAQADQLIQRNFKHIDLVVGAKGSPVQLILSSVLHVDAPTGNIPLEEAEHVAHHPMVKQAVPLALGDSYRGFRIVGTELSFLPLYEGKLAQGRLWNAPMEVILGSEAQAQSKLIIGDKFSGSHGLGEGGEAHKAFPYTVIGVLAPTGTVLDRLILTDLKSVWEIHASHDHEDESEHEKHHEHDAHEEYNPAHEITAQLIQYKSPIAAATLPRHINNSTQLQAANPAFELARLARAFGIGSALIHAFGYLLVVLAGLIIFAQLLNLVKDRRKNLVLLRVMGASPSLPFRIIMLESAFIAAVGAALGLFIAHAVSWVAARWLADSYHMPVSFAGWQAEEAWVILFALSVSVIAAAIPAIQAYRINMLQTLRAG